MFGRISQDITLERIQQHFQINVITGDLIPRKEVFPSQQVPALVMHNSQIRLSELTWGLVPFWAKKKKRRGQDISTQGWSLWSTKSSFRVSFLKRRCLIIADGIDTTSNCRQKSRFLLPGYGITGRRNTMHYYHPGRCGRFKGDLTFNKIYYKKHCRKMSLIDVVRI